MHVKTSAKEGVALTKSIGMFATSAGFSYYSLAHQQVMQSCKNLVPKGVSF